jgi:hypothetical protein
MASAGGATADAADSGTEGAAGRGRILSVLVLL